MRKLFTKVVAVAAAAVMALGCASAKGFVDSVPDGVGASVNEGGMLTIDLVAAGYDPTTVTEVSIEFTLPEEGYKDGFGGGIMMNSKKTGWHQDDGEWSWGNPDSGKPIEATGADGTYKLTYAVEKAADEYGPNDGSIEDYSAQVCFQIWWQDASDATVTKVEIKGDKAAAPAESSSSSAAAESSSTAPDSASKTGDATSVAVLAVLAVLALAGVVVTSKKRA